MTTEFKEKEISCGQYNMTHKCEQPQQKTLLDEFAMAWLPLVHRELVNKIEDETICRFAYDCAEYMMQEKLKREEK